MFSPSGIYIHIPFCRQSCIYCNFYFKTGNKHAGLLQKALLKEIVLKLNDKFPIDTLYFGGGTPSYIGHTLIREIIEAVAKHNTGNFKELTLEANPDDMSVENLRAWKDMGISRLSVGVQSFNDDLLRWMNRAHTASEAKKALQTASEMGFELSADLIFGVPGSNDEIWMSDLEQMLNFDIQHLSCYGLTLEDNTPWKKLIGRDMAPRPDDVISSTQFQTAMRFLKEKGWIQYEISNYCKPGKMAVHNTSYWQGKTYCGIGPSAHSFDGKSRSWNVSDINAYAESMELGKIPEETELLSKEDRQNEYVMTSLRTKWGCRLDRIEIRDKDFESGLEQYAVNGMLEINEGVIYLTEKGKMYADAIASDLFV